MACQQLLRALTEQNSVDGSPCLHARHLRKMFHINEDEQSSRPTASDPNQIWVPWAPCHIVYGTSTEALELCLGEAEMRGVDLFFARYLALDLPKLKYAFLSCACEEISSWREAKGLNFTFMAIECKN